MTSSWFQDPTLLAAMLGALLPFVSFVLIMVFTRPYPKLSATISVAAVSVSLICALSLLGRHWHLEQPIQYTARWMVSGKLYVPFGFMLDQLSLLMLTIVAGISFLVQVYSLGYMAGDPGFARYYAFQSLFAWAMMTMSIAPTMLQFYIFWELVGLASYFLIGFYYEKFSASEAGKKAFVMTRLGDIAFFLGLLLVLLNFGNLNILDMNSVDVTARMSPATDNAFCYSDLRWRCRQERPVPPAHLAARCHGRPHPGERLAALGHHGGGRGLHVRQNFSLFQ